MADSAPLAAPPPRPTHRHHPGLTDREKAILSLPRGADQDYVDRLTVDEIARLVAMHDKKIAAHYVAKTDKHLPETEKRRRAKIEAEKLGINEEQVPHEDRSQPVVQVRGSTLRRMGLDVHHIAAAERFGRDLELAEFSGLRCRGFEPGVDSSKSHALHLTQQDARLRLSAVKTAIGDRDYVVVTGVVLGFSARRIHAAGGKQHTSVTNDFTVAFNKLVAFYSGVPRKDRTLVALEGLISAYFEEARAEINGQEGNPARLLAAARKYESTKIARSRPARSARPVPVQRPENASALAQRVIDGLVSWGRLNLVTVESFSLVQENKRHGLRCYATRGGREISETIWATGPYLRAAIDAQFLRAATKMKWRERT